MNWTDTAWGVAFVVVFFYGVATVIYVLIMDLISRRK